MLNISAFIQNQNILLADGICVERAYQRELAFEEYLRLWLARIPNMGHYQRLLRRFVNQVNLLEAEIIACSDQELIARLQRYGLAMRKEGFDGNALVGTFAVIREASRRLNKMRHHDVQLMGAWVMLHGMIAEMQTGEGKTLVATLVACAVAATGGCAHVVTVNDYLAQRDAQLNQSLFSFFGLSVGVIQEGMEPTERSQIYRNQIVYVSNKEIVFDYLKDRIVIGSCLANHQALQKVYKPDSQNYTQLIPGLCVAIVDEADSILVDEARTPLIISEEQPDEYGMPLYQMALEISGKLERSLHFDITDHNEVWLTRGGVTYLAELTRELSGIWTSSVWRRELVENALAALHCFQRDTHYLVIDQKIQIVDEFSGRVMQDRSWEGGLHQMIEAKEGCEISGRRKTLAQITYQRFFRRYLLLCGMTGTAQEIRLELKRIYNLDVVTIPTNLPSQRKYLPVKCWRTSERRWHAVANHALAMHQQGRAVLIGTRSVEASERLGEFLQKLDCPHQVLNARNDEEEANIVAQAGRSGQVTVATNMAGRGTDIKPEDGVIELGGLYVILTEYHESSRVDRQLFGRSARQGQPGCVVAMVSLEDELFQRFAPTWLNMIITKLPSQSWLMRCLLSPLRILSQYAAEKHNARIRIASLKQDKKHQDLVAFAGEM